MKSTLSGFESIRRALTASQMGLDVTGQNVANVNTEGYTRQKVDLSSIPSESGSYRYAQIAVANVGGGVNVDGVSQIRDQFLDSRYIKENSNYNTYNTSTSALQDIANIFDEYNTDGLHTRLSDFFEKLQTLSNNPDSMESANIMRSSAQKVTEVLNQYHDRLQDIKEQRIADLNIIVDDANTIVSKINSLNIEIKNQKLQGQPSNELIDTRNSNIDKLSNYLNISVVGQADGTVSITSGVSITPGDNYLLNSSNGQITTIALNSTTLPVKIIKNGGSEFVILKGEIKGNLQILNGEGTFAAASGGDPYRGVPYYEKSINSFAKAFADTFNDLNAFNGVSKPLFEGDSLGNIDASTIKVSSDWLSDAKYITTTTIDPVMEGRNDNIMRMINSMGSDINFTPASFNGTFVEFATSLMSDIAVDVNYNKDMTRTSELVLSSIIDQRQSVTGVSLDEEAINMIRYQKSYSAAARLMTALDEMLDTLINKTGIVGR